MGSGIRISLLVMALVSHARARPAQPQPPSPPQPQPQPPSTQPPPAQPSPQTAQPQAYPPPQYAAAPQPTTSVVAAPQPAPDEPQHLLCFFGRPYECSSLLLLEVGIRGGSGIAVIDADVGLLIQNGLDAYGATIGVVGFDGPNTKDGASPWFAARYRRYFGTWGLAGDVSAGYADGPMLEVAIGWADVIALTAGMNRVELATGGDKLAAGVGLRIGSVTIGGLFYLTAIAATSSR